jgi:F-type H+-transporting ATPase subunit epsilon
MAKNTFQVEILTPEGPVFDDVVEMVSTTTSVGSVGVMANHTPLLAMLDACELRLHTESGIKRFAQGEGYMQVGGNHAMILVEEAIPAESLDRAEIESNLAKWQAELAASGSDQESGRVAARNVNRFEAFLKIASGN